MKFYDQEQNFPTSGYNGGFFFFVLKHTTLLWYKTIQCDANELEVFIL